MMRFRLENKCNKIQKFWHFVKATKSLCQNVTEKWFFYLYLSKPVELPLKAEDKTSRDIFLTHRLQILLLILSKFKWIKLLFPLRTSENLRSLREKRQNCKECFSKTLYLSRLYYLFLHEGNSFTWWDYLSE